MKGSIWYDLSFKGAVREAYDIIFMMFRSL